MLKTAVSRRIYQDEEGRGNETLETADIRARNTRSRAGSDEIAQLRNEAVDAAEVERNWLTRHPTALPKKMREQAAVERSRELAQVAQYRISLRVILFSSPSELDEDVFIAALRIFHPQQEPVNNLGRFLLSSFSPSQSLRASSSSATSSVWTNILSTEPTPFLCPTSSSSPVHARARHWRIPASPR